MLCVCAFSLLADEMPIGIPKPQFGSMLGNPVEIPLPPHPTAWPSQAVAGYYYIDNSAPQSTDNNNPFGTPNTPRKTLPISIEAGGVVEVHGGPYTYSGDFRVSLEGTATDPVFFYGVGSPVISGSRSQINGDYFVFDGFRLTATRVIATDCHHATLRNTEVAGPSTQNGVSLGGDHIVFFNNNVHHHQGDDKHGVTITQGSSYVWILNNQLHHNGGDGIQFCHGCSANPPEFIFIGANKAYGNRENGIDLKYGKNIVVSENETYNHQASQVGVEFCYDDNSGCTVGSSGSDGASIVVGSDGAPSNVWVLYNDVHDSAKGIRIEEAYDGIIMGNLVHNIEGIAIEFEKSGEGPNTVAFNTLHDAVTGIKGPWQGGALAIRIENNIISEISGTSLLVDENYAECTANNNLFNNDGRAIQVQWHNTVKSVQSGTEIDQLVSGSWNLVGDPAFFDAILDNFAIRAGGSGIDQASNLLVSLNTQYQAIFGQGQTLFWDYAHQPRSVTGQGHDLGAFEQSEVAGMAPPSPPVLYLQ